MVAHRCWLVYETITDNFEVSDQFHIQFPELVELALTAGYLELRVQVGKLNYSLHIQEEYAFKDQTFTVETYSYVLLEPGQHVIVRADPLPHHSVDYKNHPLAHYPHHLHDENGRIHSFTGRIEDFMRIVASHLGR